MNNLTAVTLNNFVDYANDVVDNPVMSALSYTHTCSLFLVQEICFSRCKKCKYL